MPLITLAGTPCTGKSTFAQRLAEALRASSDKEVVLINEGMPAEVDQLIERARGTTSDTELDKIRLIKDVALGSTALIK